MKTLSVTTEIPLQRVADLLCSAIESGGCAYWCRISRYAKPSEKVAHSDPKGGKIYRHLDYPLSPGGAVIFRDTETTERPPMRLDLDAVQRGLSLMPSKAPGAWGDFLSGKEDMHTGDIFVQLCLLGDVVYG